MDANYHTHTWRCHHATGLEREYVENAIAGGLKILGFSDHTPMPYDGGYVSSSKMTMDQLRGYVDTLTALREEYRRDIEIHIGLEVEYYPKYFNALRAFVGDYEIEYFLLGQHHLGNEIGDVFSGNPTDNPDHLIRYCLQCMEAIETGCFTYLAHPDLIYFTGDDALYSVWMRKLCECALAHDMPLEINLLGLQEHRNYPKESFWQIAGEVGNTAIFGSDAHHAHNVWRPDTVEVANDLASRYNIKVIDRVPFRDFRL